MASIAVIVKSKNRVEDLSMDWEPEILGTRDHIIGFIRRSTGTPISVETQRIKLADTPLELAIELEIEEGDVPTAITVSGIFGSNELSFLRELCCELSARLYDSESADFII